MSLFEMLFTYQVYVMSVFSFNEMLLVSSERQEQEKINNSYCF